MNQSWQSAICTQYVFQNDIGQSMLECLMQKRQHLVLGYLHTCLTAISIRVNNNLQ
jgi:hypothetical protein